MKKKIAYIVSVIFTVPFVAFFVFTIMWVDNPNKNYNNNFYYYINSLLFFSLIPYVTYILTRFTKKYKQKGREFERKLAFIFSFLGYFLGILSLLFLSKPTKSMITLYLSYFISAIILTITNKVFHFKASGHSCGITGPIIALNFYSGIKTVWMLIFIPIVIWSRIEIKRHDLKQSIVGALTSFFVTITLILSLYY
ncbi:hypothetical protein ACAG39_09705 [Caldicellulosiruptoraceae bacterium PP1]